jgi:anti-repressor protein
MNAEIEIRVQQELQRIIANPREIIMYAAKAIQDADEKLNQLQARVTAELEPKAEMYDMVMGTDKLIDMAVVAKTLNFKDMGRNKLFGYLQSKGILDGYNKPYQRYVDSGYFKIVEESFKNNGYEGTYFKTVVTQKGVEFIGKNLKGDKHATNPR